MGSLKNSSDTKMSTQTPEIPLGATFSTRLENAGMLKVRIGQKQPRGEFTVTSEADEVLFTSTETLREFEIGCGGNRCNAFYIELVDVLKQQTISLRRPPSTTTKVEVRVNGVIVSVVRQQATFRKPLLYIKDVTDQQVLRIKGPVAFQGKCDFDLQTITKQSIGAVTKLWGPHVQQSVDDYKIIFPKDLDVKCKAAVLGACFLIDFLCCEDEW